MDVLKLPISKESAKHNFEINQGVGTAPINGLVNYPTLNVETILNTPKKRANSKSPVMGPVLNQTDLALTTPGSPLARLNSETKNKSSLKTIGPSPKASPQRKRKRYLSNPGNATTNVSSRLGNQNNIVTQVRSPTTSIKRKR